MSEICTVGLSYRSAPLALRELVAVSAEGVTDKLRQLTRQCKLPEAAILSTCNRTEIYCLSDAPERVAAWLNAAGGGAADAHLYRMQSRAAVRHLFRVASGLESQLLGEPEITGQVKQFARMARESGTAGAVINRLMDGALACAKMVRARTDIGRHSLSYPALALRAALGIFPRAQDLSALFVGTGDMTLAGMPIFADRGVARLAVAGRSPDKTESVARRWGAEALSFARLAEALPRFDVVLCATASTVPVIGKGAVESALKLRRRKPMMFADLALPRDLEPEISQLDDVFVYQLDQFGDMAAASDELRQDAARAAQGIVDEHAERFVLWLGKRGGFDRVRGYREEAARIRTDAVRAAHARLDAGADARKVVEDITHQMLGRLMHAPTKWLREAGHAPAGTDDDARDN